MGSGIADALGRPAFRGEGAYVPYVCCGDPSLDFSAEISHCLQKSGADMIEIGIPFSDTLADGQVIQAASERALARCTIGDSIGFISRLRSEGLGIPILPMTYYNLVFRYGVERFCISACEAGADGLLVPDVPFEERGRLARACSAQGMDLISFIAPTTPPERMEKILRSSSGFAYAVAAMGVTGVRERLSQDALSILKRAKSIASLPVLLGFGISTPQHASQAMEAGADGIVEGSKLIKIYSQFMQDGGIRGKAMSDALDAVSAHAFEMKSALRLAVLNPLPT